MTTNYALSLAKIMEEERDGANSFLTQHLHSEFIDNSYDADSQTVSIASVQHPDGSYTMIIYDEGSGVTDLMDLYSCGKHTTKKPDGKRGLKNRGHRGSVGALTGRDSLFYVSRPTGAARPSTLKVDMKGLYSANDRAKKGLTRDIGSVDASEFFVNNKGGGLTDEGREAIQALHDHSTEALHDHSTEPQLKTFLDLVLTNKKSQYFLMAVNYRQIPANHERDIHDAIQSYCHSYALALEAGRQINFFASDPSQSIILSAKDAVPHLGNNKASHIGGKLMFWLPASSFDSDGQITDNQTGAVLQFTIGQRSLWLYANTKWVTMDCRISEGAMREPPEGMDKMRQASPPMIWRLAVISDEEEAAQKKALGAHLKKGDQLRGISLVFVDRSLGWTVYNPKWEHPRNVGGLRCEIICGDHVGAENFLRIQTQKHSMSFGVQHPMLQAFQNLLIGRTIISKYSHCNTLRGKAIELWNGDELCRLLENPKLARSVDTKSTVANPIANAVANAVVNLVTNGLANAGTNLVANAGTKAGTNAGTNPFANPVANAEVTVTKVTAHQRITSKSEKDVLSELLKIKALNFSQLQSGASAITDSSMTDLYKATQLIQTYYTKRTTATKV